MQFVEQNGFIENLDLQLKTTKYNFKEGIYI